MLPQLPSKPGVYLIKDSSGKIIYIGKALSIANRVRSHIRPDSKLAGHIHDIDYIVTATELEALILEANLIKKHQPRFNVLLRDDKQYPYLKITVNEDWPRLILTRKIEDDGAKYFGPYRGQTVRDIIKTVKRLFQIRWCKAVIKRDQPCFYYHLGKCLAPCSKNISKDRYLGAVKEIELFLEGKYDVAIDKLRSEMAKASDLREYELAGRIRDKIRMFERMFEEQKVVTKDRKDRDIFSIQVFGSNALALVLQVRQGKLLGKESYFIKKIRLPDDDLLLNALSQYYSSAANVPGEIVADIKDNEIKLIEDAIYKLKKTRVKIKRPNSGIYRGLFRMAQENAKLIFEQRLKAEGDIYKCLIDLKAMLHLERLPYRIEAFDISTTMGVESVGSMVVFEDGMPYKQDYRKFKIMWTEGMNDTAGINEIVRRRYSGSLARELPLPDLILVDGGLPQLGAAKRSAPKGLPMAALAKKFEEIYLPGWKNPLKMNKNIPALKLLRRIRDEAHRFAITFHRKRRAIRMLGK